MIRLTHRNGQAIVLQPLDYVLILEDGVLGRRSRRAELVQLGDIVAGFGKVVQIERLTADRAAAE